MVITSFNPATENLEKTFLDLSVSAGATSLTVKNNQGFSDADRILLGEMGAEKSEIVSTTGTTGDTGLTVSATKFSHEADTPVYILQFDQTKFYRSTTGSDGTYSVLSTKTIDVDNAEQITTYDDATGTASYFYKIALFHSVLQVESQKTDPIPGSGFRRRQVGNIIDELQADTGDLTEQFTTRTEWLAYMNDCSNDLQEYAAKPFEFLKTRTTLTRTANRNYVDFPTDSNSYQTMWKFDRMDYNFTDTATDPDTDNITTIHVIPVEDFRNKYSDTTVDSTTVKDDKPEAMALDTFVNRFRFSHPFETTTGAVFYLHYWKYFDTFDSEGDEIETPTPLIYKNYAKSKYYRKRAAVEPGYESQANYWENEYLAERSRLSSHNRKDQGSPRQFSLETPTFKSYRR